MKFKHFAALAGAFALAGAAFWYQNAASSQAPLKSGGQPPVVVGVVAPLRQDVPVVVTASGSVSPVSMVDLRAQTSSIIRQVHIKEGQFVKAGALMFSLDDRLDRANVDKAVAQVARDQASVQDLERQVKRGEELFGQKFIAQSAVDTQRSALEAARAQLASDKAGAQASRVSESYATIRAPMAGRVGAIGVYAGSLVQPATSLTTITQLDPINVAFTLPEANLAALLAAQQRGPVRVDAGEGAASARGLLSFVDNTVDPVSGTIRIKAQFDNHDGQMWPGQYLDTRVTVSTLKDALVIPQAAIITNTRGTFVYTVGADETAQQRPVARLHAFGLMAAVSGLAGNEKVITDGKQNLRPGSKVRIAEPAAAGGAVPSKGSRGDKGGKTGVAGTAGTASQAEKGAAP
ncbi:MAG: efflux RND transporter periplasmic adaptor subunit [Pseudomonadota bacterium]